MTSMRGILSAKGLRPRFFRVWAGTVISSLDSCDTSASSDSANYDKTKKAIQEITDMPDRLVDLFIRFCLQTSGNLSLNKRKSHFDFLSDEEIHRMEKAVQSAYKP